MKQLKEQIKSGNFQTCYLFYGNENYLKKYYMEQMKQAIIPVGMEMMNLDVLEGKQVSSGQIIDAAETLPFMTDKRLIVIKESELFQSGRKDETEKTAAFLSKLPETTCLIFIESQIDKRNKLYKQMDKFGRIVEFATPKESELAVWLQKGFKKYHKQISPKTAAYMIRTVGSTMEALVEELQKLIAYKNHETEITEDDIDAICTKSLETKIFDLVAAIGNKNSSKSLEIYGNLMLLKESPIMVLTMITRQFRLILESKILRGMGVDTEGIAKRMGQRSFVIRECLKQGGNFSESLLKQAMKECLETDIAIKTGKMDGTLAVEILIIKYSG